MFDGSNLITVVTIGGAVGAGVGVGLTCVQPNATADWLFVKYVKMKSVADPMTSTAATPKNTCLIPASVHRRPGCTCRDGRFGLAVLDILQHRVLDHLLCQHLLQLELLVLEELDGLLKLRRHHQLLRHLEIEFLF